MTVFRNLVILTCLSLLGVGASQAESIWDYTPEKTFNTERLLKGCIFDLKRGSDGKELATVLHGDAKRRMSRLHKALEILDRSWNIRALEKIYYKADRVLYNPRIFIVNEEGKGLDAKLATEAFADDDGKAPFPAPGWLCYYEGFFKVPEDGEYRFVGMGDDALLVAVNRKTVFYAFWPGEGHGPAVRCQDDWEPKNHCGKSGTDARNIGIHDQRKTLFKGSWLKLRSGRSYRIQIALGESAGGLAGACLGLQKKGRDTDDNFPMFAVGEEEIPEAWNIGETGRYNTSEMHSTSRW